MKNRAPLHAALVAPTMVWGGSFVAAMPWQAWAAMAFLSLACTVAGFTVWNWALLVGAAVVIGGVALVNR